MQRLGTSPKRKILLEGLLMASKILFQHGAKYLYLDGSFATNERNPNDIDCLYDLVNLDFDALPAVFRDFSDNRAAQKATYGCEFFPSALIEGSLGEPFLTFFQHDKAGRPKGIVVLDLGTLP